MTPTPEHPERDPREADGTQGEGGFTFSDKRRVNPEDGSVRPSGASADSDGQAAESPVDPIDAEAASLYEQAAQAPSDGAPHGDEDPRVAELQAKVADLTEELKRSQAEYVNSRRRIEASAEASVTSAVGRVLGSLIGVLDDVALGRQHGDIAEGTPFHAITTKLEDALGAHGLERFGEVGETFDPNLHEALMHEDSDEVEVNTIKTVLQPGYRMNGRVLRPARVATYGPQ